MPLPPLSGAQMIRPSVTGPGCHLGVRCDSAASAADLSPRLLATRTRDTPVNIDLFDELRRRGFIEGHPRRLSQM